MHQEDWEAAEVEAKEEEEKEEEEEEEEELEYDLYLSSWERNLYLLQSIITRGGRSSFLPSMPILFFSDSTIYIVSTDYLKAE